MDLKIYFLIGTEGALLFDDDNIRWEGKNKDGILNLWTVGRDEKEVRRHVFREWFGRGRVRGALLAPCRSKDRPCFRFHISSERNYDTGDSP